MMLVMRADANEGGTSMVWITTRTPINATTAEVYCASVHETEADARARVARTASPTRLAASVWEVPGSPTVGEMVRVK